jgi:hypothetical protein
MTILSAVSRPLLLAFLVFMFFIRLPFPAGRQARADDADAFFPKGIHHDQPPAGVRLAHQERARFLLRMLNIGLPASEWIGKHAGGLLE